MLSPLSQPPPIRSPLPSHGDLGSVQSVPSDGTRTVQGDRMGIVRGVTECREGSAAGWQLLASLWVFQLDLPLLSALTAPSPFPTSVSSASCFKEGREVRMHRRPGPSTRPGSRLFTPSASFLPPSLALPRPTIPLPPPVSRGRFSDPIAMSGRGSPPDGPVPPRCEPGHGRVLRGWDGGWGMGWDVEG